jgi:hypothetical protein
MAVAWEAEVTSARVMGILGDRVTDPRQRARLLLLAAFCRAHASRLLARLSALGRGPLPVPPEVVEVGSDTRAELMRECRQAHDASQRYQAMARMARAHADFSSAWVCELNRGEEEERALELARLCEMEAWEPEALQSW